LDEYIISIIRLYSNLYAKFEEIRFDVEQKIANERHICGMIIHL